MTTIFMVFTCAFLNVLHIISTNGMAKIAIQPNGSTIERRISFPL